MDLPPRGPSVVHGLKPSRNPGLKIVRVVVLEGVELAKKDIFGLSDPYCKIKLFRGDREFGEIDTVVTDTIKKTLNPVWYQGFFFRVNPIDNRLLFEVFSENRVTRDDFLGEVELPLNSLPTESSNGQIRPGNYNLRPRSIKSRVRGHLQVQLSFLPSEDRSLSQSTAPATSTDSDSDLRVVGNHYPEEFNAFLVQIADEITQEELSMMKFLCQDPNNNLPRGELEAIENPCELLSLLRRKHKIWPEDVSYLIWLLRSVGNVQLAVSIEEQGTPSLPGGQPRNLPCLTSHFIGRDTEVRNIIKKLRIDLFRMVVLVSLPGMGKTEVGIRVSQLLQHQCGLSVIHIRVERHDKLGNICGEILDQLSFRRWSLSVDHVLQAKRKLSELQEDTVIVLDNAEEIQGKKFDEFAEWLVKHAPKAQLLITTQEDVGFVSADVCKVRLEPLDTDSSAKLLKNLVEDCNEEHSKELGKLCGGIPLLLVNCSDLLNDGFSPEVLIQELTNNPIKLLKTNAAGVHDGLGRFFGKFSEEVIRNLVLFSVFPSTFSVEDIQFLFQDLVQFETVKTRMIKIALLQETINKKMRMHGLVRAYCRAERDSLNMVELERATQHKFNHHYLGLLKDFAKEFISKNSALIAIQKFRQQKANIMEALNNCFEDTSDVDEKELVIDVVTSTEVLDFLAKVLTPPKECAKLYQKCCDITKTSRDKRRHADSLHSLGFRRLCDVAHSKDNREEGRVTLAMFQEAYEIRRTLPEEEQKCETHAHTTSKLGVCHVLQGEEEKGRTLIHEGIAMRRNLGVSLYIADGYCDLGNCYRLCGDYQTAIDIWKENTLPVYKEELGDHPWTASILSFIADSYKALADGSSKQGYIDQAEMYFREALELQRRLLGVHQDTARLHVHLSDVLVIQGELNSALQELEAALEIQNDILGPQHKITIETVELRMMLLGVHQALKGEPFDPEESSTDGVQMHEVIPPSYVLARGEKAMAAYQRALENGETLDKRVKVMLIGQDRVGKTSVGKALKGEPFDPEESSTDGVQMHEVLKNVGIQPWKNFTIQEETTTYHHKCAEFISRDLLTELTEAQALMTTPELSKPPVEKSSFEPPEKPNDQVKDDGRSDIETDRGLETDPSVNVEPNSGLKTEVLKHQPSFAPGKKDGNLHQVAHSFNKTPQGLGRKLMPDKIVNLLDQNLQTRDFVNEEGIWPIIWDFAGQAVYRSIHPIFMSSEAVYLLVVDLSKDLFATAQCLVKEEGHKQVVIQAPDPNDTNLDHIMRWMDLVHSLRHSEKLPPVILVGTHVDCIDNPEEKLEDIKKILSHYSRIFSKRITATLNVDNTKAGQSLSQEDAQISNLRKKVKEVAEAMPQTKIKVPLKWLQVEDKVIDEAKKGEKYTTRKRFRVETVDKICQFEKEDDYEHLLNFLHDRGTIVYHVYAENPDGLVVLDPQWLIDVLCKIISVKNQGEEGMDIFSLRQDLREKGIFHEELLNHACNTLELTQIRESLLFVMKKFNLLCECRSNNDKSSFLVPCMLTATLEDLIGPTFDGSAPVYITFDTDYVPAGLFCRILVLFGKWAASKTSCKQQQLFANAARFIIGECTCLGLVCYKSVIQAHTWTMDNSNPVEKEPRVCAEAYRCLVETLETLKRECYWMRAVSWKFCGQCKLCPGEVNPAGKCIRHQEQKCFNADCAHYVCIESNPFCCERAVNITDLRLSQTWIQALPNIISQDRSIQTLNNNTFNQSVVRHFNNSNSHSIPSLRNGEETDQALNVTLLADEWGSSMGGLSTINRNLAINLAKHTQVHVTLFVPEGFCSEEEKIAAGSHNVAVRVAKRLPGFVEPRDWLIHPPSDLAIDVVFGHGVNLGKQAQLIRESHSCKWVQVVHTAPEELGIHKNYPKAISKGEEKNITEVGLCKLADVVVTIGPKLTGEYSSQLRAFKKHEDIIQLTPGILSEFSVVEQTPHEGAKFKVLIFGRGDPEDFSVKGYDIAAKAIAALKDNVYRLIFVGAPDGKQDQVAEALLQSRISKDQLIVRKFVKKEQLKALFSEVDLVVMPSRTEGFGLTALEALSAGLPILVSGNSGLGEALRSLRFGEPFVIESDDPKVWATRIAAVRRKDRRKRLEEVKKLRKCYDEKFSWEKQSSILVDKIRSIVHDPVTKTWRHLHLIQDDASKAVENKIDVSEQLQMIARTKGFVISDNQGSGNCMFYALSEQLFHVQGIKISHHELRQALVQYLGQNPRLPDGTELVNFVDGRQSWSDYLQHMTKDGSWGDHLILFVAANLFKTCIRVVSSLPHHDDLIIKPYHHITDSNPLVLGHVHEMHYVSLVKVEMGQ